MSSTLAEESALTGKGKLIVVSNAARLDAKTARPDFAGNAALITLGCAKNEVDSEVMLGALTGRGFRVVTNPALADLIVVNTCAFLQSAVDESLDAILSAAEFKRTGRCRKLIVAGCLVERYRGELRSELPEVDSFISTDDLLRVGEERESTESAFDNARRPYFLYDESMPRVLGSGGGASAYLKIAEGCDRPCTFCIIPKIRGAFRSRSIESIKSEVVSLLHSGVSEVNLVAQDLTAYGTDHGDSARLKSKLPELLREIVAAGRAISPFWVRLLYAYPIGVTEELIRLIQETPEICNYLDLPLQHISGPVLKRMQRPLGERGTRALIEQIRSLAPEIALRTTFIVGFPGETEYDVKRLEEFVRAGHFAHVGVFCYSQEREAVSFAFRDQVPEELKNERRNRIMVAQQQVVERHLSSFVGEKIPVFIEGPHPESEHLLSARAEWQAPETDGVVIINDLESNADTPDDVARKSLSGQFGVVEVVECLGYDLVGRLTQSN